MRTDPNIISLKPSELALAVADAIRSNVIPCILSSPGMGKSDIVAQVVEEMNMRLIDERASTMGVEDWRGVPDIDRKKKRTIWYAPDFLPAEEDEPTAVFMDEITATPANCQAPLLQLFLDRRIGTVYQAPATSRFICAGNLMDDGAFVNKLGSALRNRMIFLYLKPDMDDWCRWAYKNDIAPVVIAFIRFRPNLLYAFDKNEMSSPTARGWEFVSNLVKGSKNTGRVRDALIQGIIGHVAMVEFTAFEQIFSTLPSIENIKLNPDVADLPPKDKPELAYAISNALANHLTVNNIDRIMVYLGRLPEEYSVFAVKMALRRDKKLAAAAAFTKWSVQHANAMN